MADDNTRHIKRYKHFANQCVSEGIPSEHIPMIWIAYHLEEIDASLYDR